MNMHRSKRECVVIMFLHCLLQTVFTTPVNGPNVPASSNAVQRVTREPVSDGAVVREG